MNERAQFLAYVIKVFALNRVMRGVRARSAPAPHPHRPRIAESALGRGPAGRQLP